MERIKCILKGKEKLDEEAMEDSAAPQKERCKGKESETVGKDFTSSQKAGDKDSKEDENVQKTAGDAAAATPTASGSAGSAADSYDKRERLRYHKMMRMGGGVDVDPDDDDDVNPSKFSRFFHKMMRKGRGSISSDDDAKDRQHHRMMMMMMDEDMMDDDPRRMFGHHSVMDYYYDPYYHCSSHQSHTHRDLWAHTEQENTKDNDQRLWWLPELVKPIVDSEDATEQMQVEYGVIQTDAALYTVTVHEEGKEPQPHSLLRMPSSVPTEISKCQEREKQEGNRFNLLMADTSGSMSSYWKQLAEGWNEHVAPVLKGRTVLYGFNTVVSRFPEGTKLSPLYSTCGGTDLTGALQKMTEEVYKCTEKYIKLFLVTDGDHNATGVTPAEILDRLHAPSCKVVEVYLLGAGSNFPVQISITMRSILHNGSTNIPTLFWAQTSSTMVGQMAAIGEEIGTRVSRTMELSQEGYSLPNTELTKTFYPGDWVYFSCGPEALHNLVIKNGPLSAQIQLEAVPASPPILNEVFRQWNSILIQRHNSKKELPENAIPFMESLFKSSLVTPTPATSIAARLFRKTLATYQTEFQTLMNKVREVLTKGSYGSEMQLAENILCTTVGGGKYESKVLAMKGHTDEDYKNDCKNFLQVLTDSHEAIAALEVKPDDCCHVLLSSTLSDLQDPNFSRLMDELNKFEFLREFTISGVGVFVPMRDSITINPWSLSVQAILKQPFSVVSQKAMEYSPNIDPTQGKNKEVQLKADDENTRFNAIIPIFPPEVASVMEPIVRTNLYAMCTTFAVLKNPHIIDFSVHFVALGVLWVRLLHEYPTLPRPDHVNHKIQSIEATAKLYVSRPSYAKYWKVLKEDTAQGLMTESTEKVDGKTVKCESLIKPMFFLHLMRQLEEVSEETTIRIIKMMLFEYTGRCLSHYKLSDNNATPFTDFFAPQLANEETRQEWKEKYTGTYNNDDIATVLLKDFYTKEKAVKGANKIAVQKLKQAKATSITVNIPIDLVTDLVLKLRNVTAAGDVSWPTLRTYVGELGLPENSAQEMFSKESLMTYTVHALQYRSSRERLETPLPVYQEALDIANRAVQYESKSWLCADSLKQIQGNLLKGWLQEYANAHSDVVRPMTKEQIVAEAQQRGIEVTLGTFDQVYRHYRPDTGLVGNACQSLACPFFLKPNRSYNQHASVERLLEPSLFPHAFHKVAYRHRQDQLPNALANLECGVYRPPRGPQAPLPHERVTDLADKLASLQMLYRSGY